MTKTKDLIPKATEVAAILLAAGRSRRMGAFKPLLPFGDRTVIESCITNLRDADLEDIVVVLGHRAEDVRRHLGDHRLRFAFNNDSESEMGVSIMRGVEQVGSSAGAVIIALVDQPAAPPGTIKNLVREWRETGAKLVQPVYRDRGGHPVLIDLEYREELLNLDPKKGLRALFERHRDEARRVPVESPYVARDIDTWEDYRQLHEELFGLRPAK